MPWSSNVLWERLDDNIRLMDISDDSHCFPCIFLSLIDIRWYIHKGGNNPYIPLGATRLYLHAYLILINCTKSNLWKIYTFNIFLPLKNMTKTWKIRTVFGLTTSDTCTDKKKWNRKNKRKKNKKIKWISPDYI